MKDSLIIAFGSQVSGKTRSSSDYDVAILKPGPKPMSLSERSRFSLRIAKKLGINEDTLDLVDLRTAPPLLQYEIAKKGKLLSGTLFDFTRFKVNAWKTYEDTARFRRLRENKFKKYV